MLHFNKDTIQLPIDNGYFYIKNPRVKLGEQVINGIQFKIFSLLQQGKSLEEISSSLNVQSNSITNFLAILAENDIVRYDENFEKPQKNESGNFGIWVHTSNRCNLSCPYCYVNAEARGKIMKDNIWDNLEERIYSTVQERKSKSFQLKLAGGEPLLTFHIWKNRIPNIKSRLLKLDCKLKLQILTNGTLINEDILNFIKEHKIGVGISLDGFGEFHNITRQYRNGKGSFDKVVATINKFRQNDIQPYLTAVITNSNYQGLAQLTEYFTDNNLRFRFSLEKGTLLNMDKILPYLINSYKIVEGKIDNGTYTQFLKHTLCDLSLNRPIYDTPCGVGSRYGYVSELGNLHVCQADSQSKSVGDIFENKNLMTQILNQQNFPELIEIAVSCKTCRYKLICHGGCPVSKVNNKSPFCDVFHIILPIILKLRGKSILLLQSSQEM